MELDKFQVGQVVISRKGKDTGTWYVIVGTDEQKGRVLVCEGDKYPLQYPKSKNPKHLQKVNRSLPVKPDILGNTEEWTRLELKKLLENEKLKSNQDEEVD